jgi:hypothetical protein
MPNWLTFGIDEKYMGFPEIAGKYSGRLIIASGGRCVWDDLERIGMAKNHDPHPHIMCINEMIMFYPGRVEHAYSNNHSYLKKWVDTRRDQYLTRYGDIKNTHSNKTGGKWTWPWPGHGTSSLNAVYTGIALGYTDIVLCGVPLDDSGHFWEAPWEKSNFVHEIADRDGEIKYWANANRKIFEGKVKSMSGRTRELLGEP